jgi:hypothetical protein
VPPALAEIDQRIAERIAAEHQFMCDIIAGVIANLQSEWEVGGSGWQLLASQGKRGVAGERGERGPQGNPGLSGATIRDWKIDRARYFATPLMADGSEGPPLELRGLFEQFFSEVR